MIQGHVHIQPSRSILDTLKIALHCLCLALLAGFLLRGYLLLGEARETLRLGQQQLQAVSMGTWQAVTELREYARAAKAQMEDPQVKRGIGLLLRKGDDVSRTIDKANNVLDNLKNAIRDTSRNINEGVLPSISLAVDRTAYNFNQSIIPELARTAQAATAALETTARAIERTSAELSQELAALQAGLDAMQRRISDERYDKIMDSLVSSAGHADETLNHLERKTKELTRPLSWVWRGVKTGIVLVGRIFIP